MWIFLRVIAAVGQRLALFRFSLEVWRVVFEIGAVSAEGRSQLSFETSGPFRSSASPFGRITLSFLGFSVRGRSMLSGKHDMGTSRGMRYLRSTPSDFK